MSLHNAAPHDNDRALPARAALIFLFPALLLFSAVIIGGAGAALAQAQYSNAEKVAFAFYRIGGFTPNFRSWIEKMESYTNTPEAEREHFVTRQLIRLEQGFLNFDPAQDTLEVSLPATVHYPTQAEREEYDREGSSYPVEISIRNFDDGFFPYRIGSNWIALTPENLGAVSAVRMSAAEFTSFHQLMGLQSQNTIQVEIILVAYRIEAEQPIMVKGQTLWPLYAQIAYIQAVNPRQRETTWPIYQADWYRTQTEERLLQLYSR